MGKVRRVFHYNFVFSGSVTAALCPADVCQRQVCDDDDDAYSKV